MRIAQLTYSTKPRGGVVHTLALAEALADRGHEVQIWTLGRGDDTGFFRRVDPRVDVRIIPFPGRDGEDVGARIERSIATMARALDVTADVVHAQDCVSANAATRRGISVVRTIHHLDAFSTPQLVECHDRAVVEPVARLCVSHAVAREVREAYGLRPEVIPNGVDAARFAQAAGESGASGRTRWRDRLGDYVLALGGIEPRKGSLDLLEAYAIARSANPGLRLVFGGGETLFDYRSYRDQFDLRARQLGITPTILGPVDDPEVPTLVAAAQVLAFVSTKEGFGLAAMEALAAGTPVVARDLPVLREVFGDTVRFARTPQEIADQLLAAVADPESAAGRGGYELASRHSWSAAARAHEDFYRRVLQTGGAVGGSIDVLRHPR